MISVVIIGLLAALAIPAFTKLQRRTQSTRFVSDLRVFVQAFETYSLENGGWPANAGGGVVPTGMTGTFKTEVWTAPTVLGGRWNWDRTLNSISASVSLSDSTATIAQMTEIDAMIDDGDLSTGNFQLIRARYMYILEI